MQKELTPFRGGRLTYILNVGELLIDIIPTTEMRLGEACLSPYAGGAVANVGVAVARLGGFSRFLGGVAEDEFGRLLVQVLDENHVDTQYVRVIKGAPTAVALVTLQADGQRRFTFFRQGTADLHLQVEDLNWSAWHDVAICHVGGVLLSAEPARSATLAAIDPSPPVGSLVSFDVDVRPALLASRAAIRDTVAQVVQRSDNLKFHADQNSFLRAQERSSTAP